MFDSIGWFELLILVVVGLFILGPERLPQAAAWLGKSVRQVKDYASGARDQLRSELGPEFDDLRKPLEDLRGIRSFNPRSAMTQHLFDGDNPLDRINEDTGNGHKQAKPAQHQPLRQGEVPPYDSDTT